MKLAKELAAEAKKKGVCEPWYKELRTLDDKRAMVEMYIKGIDFCLKNDYPGNDYIRDNFSDIMEDYGVFVDDEIDLANVRRCIALGATNGRVAVSGYSVCEIYAKHRSRLEVTVNDHAFVRIDAFDNAEINIHALGESRVLVNQYGGCAVTFDNESTAYVKIVNKNKKTY